MRSLVWFLALCLTAPAFADSYVVNVTRVGSDVYKVDEEDVLVYTSGCYKYVSSESSSLEMRGYTGEISFTNSGGTCEVKAVYGRITPEIGNYPVTVRRRGDDWYEIRGQGMYIKTSSCPSRALDEDAILALSSGGVGTLSVEGDECEVEGIYSRMQM